MLGKSDVTESHQLRLPRFQRAHPCAWSLLFSIVLSDLLTVRQPEWPFRRNPRCVKRRLSTFKSKASCQEERLENPPKTFLETLTLLPFT